MEPNVMFQEHPLNKMYSFNVDFNHYNDLLMDKITAKLAPLKYAEYIKELNEILIAVVGYDACLKIMRYVKSPKKWTWLNVYETFARAQSFNDFRFSTCAKHITSMQDLIIIDDDHPDLRADILLYFAASDGVYYESPQLNEKYRFIAL